MILGQQLLNKPVLSLRTGAPVATIVSVIINPNNLKIEGWHATDINRKTDGILLGQDVREIAPQGFVVNDHDALSEPGDLIRLKPVLDLKFQLIGKSVYTEDNQKLGRVNDYAFEKNGYFVQKIYVEQSLVKSFSGGALIVDRNQITAISPKRITVKEATEPGRVMASSRVTAPESAPA
jgi:sporulation protein YlmC with PRC-barrel domain